MRALQTFDIDNKAQTPDELIALMGSQWDSLIADNSARSGRSLALTSAISNLSSSIPLVTSASYTSTPAMTSLPLFVPITEQEKAELTAVRGCWNCCGKPTDAGWVPHQRTTCPGNPATGARPGRDYRPQPLLEQLVL
ncbi:hypothetical protein M422DRAFT_38827 [Sphaerobolus stellatus SS14]|uniref:Uncharacterized protein n=1 Tax=Sphaerobolus stellatus (strain SS14) TaxID=990650 RepID=A0A0C9TTV4_SPHS4|nr:hypothetical protein M422DRAFT_38827 [Sphaerobolus stellatus SS14]